MAGRTGAQKKTMIAKIIAFLVAVGIGLIPLASWSNNDANVYIRFDDPECVLRYGEPVRIRCVVDGVYEPYTIRWQYFDNQEQDGIAPVWIDIDCTDDVYEFILTPENEEYYYRVVVTCRDETHFIGTPTDTNLRSENGDV